MKRILSLFLALMLALTCLSAVAFADEAGTDGIHTATSRVFEGELKTGGNITPSSATTQNPVWDAENGTFTWVGYAPQTAKRSTFKFNTPLKAYIGRSYKFTLDISAANPDGSAVAEKGFVNQVAFSTTGASDYIKVKSLENNAETTKHTQIQWSGLVSSSRKQIESDDTLVTYIPSTKNGGIYDQVNFINIWHNSSSSQNMLYTVYGLDVDETITYCDETFNVGANGSAYITSYADLDGKNAMKNREVSDGEKVAFEMNTQPTVTVAANKGFAIDAVTCNGTEIADAADKATYSFTLDKISGAGSISVSFKPTTETAVNYERISLSSNTTLYKNATRAPSPIVVTAYDSEGNETDITGSGFLTYTTSNPLAFSLSENLLATGSVNGMSIVTATYNRADKTTISASVIFQNTNNIANTMDSTNATYKYAEPGHALGSTNCIAWHSGLDKSESWQLRAYYGANSPTPANVGYDWADGKYRLASGWFYDDGVNANYFSAFFKNLRLDAREKSTAFNFNQIIGKTSASSANYAPSNTGNSVKATKGWHQVVIYIDNSGYDNIYIDGVLTYRDKISVGSQSGFTTDYASYIELRAVRPNTQDTFKFDEIYIADYPTVKPEYTSKVTMSQENELYVNGTAVVQDGSEFVVKAGDSLNFETKTIDKVISTIERVDILGFNSKTYDVKAKTYSISDIDTDAEYIVNFAEVEGATKVEKEVFYEDFKGTAISGEDKGYAKIAQTNRNRLLKIKAGVNVSYDGENGYVTYAKASKTAENPAPPHAYFSISNIDGSELFTYYVGRSYRYEYNVKGLNQQIYMQTVTFVNEGQWGANINPSFNSADFTDVTQTLDISSLSADNGKTWTAKSRIVSGVESVTFTDLPRTFNEMRVVEIKHCMPVTLTKSGNGTVSFVEVDNKKVVMNDGLNDVERGDRTFNIIPDEGYKIESVELDGKTIPVTNENGFYPAFNIDNAKSLNVKFVEKPAVAPKLTTGEPMKATNYVFGEGYKPSNTIVGYATIDVGYGKTVTECGYYITNEAGSKLTLPAIAIPAGNTYGIRMFGTGIVSGTYTIQPYIKLSDDSVVTGDEKTVTFE